MVVISYILQPISNLAAWRVRMKAKTTARNIKINNAHPKAAVVEGSKVPLIPKKLALAQPKTDRLDHHRKRLEKIQEKSRADARAAIQEQPKTPLPVTAKERWVEEQRGKRKEGLREQVER